LPKYLVIRFSSIGDIVLTSPVVLMLKKQVPNAEVHFLTKKNFESVVKNNPNHFFEWVKKNLGVDNFDRYFFG
jgi:ADP-heptose:LPS heptosyltransferase